MAHRLVFRTEHNVSQSASVSFLGEKVARQSDGPSDGNSFVAGQMTKFPPEYANRSSFGNAVLC